MPEDTTITTPPPLCDEPGCGAIAVASYAWDWGKTGYCCATHQVTLSQTARNLKRHVQITALQPGAERPVTRQERIQAKATQMALEAELDEAKARGMELYRSNEQLQAQLKTERAKRAELEAQLQSAQRTTAQAQETAGKLRQQAAKENAELQQLRALVPQSAPPAPQEVDPPTQP